MTTARRIDVLRAAMTVDERLDDIKRAQIWAELEPRLGEPVPARRRWPLALAAVAVAAAIAVVWLRPAHPTARTLSAPAETTLAASLGPHTRAELVGPATLDVIGAPGDATAVRLHRGTLVAEFSGGPGRSLRIETADAVVEIVGTLFSVEARDGATCVSVEHGKVRVTSRAGVVAVGGGQTWCSTRRELRPLPAGVHERLTRFEAVMVARSAPAEVVAPAPAPVTAPPAPPAPPSVVHPAPAVAPSRPVVVATQPPPHLDPVAPEPPAARDPVIESVETPPPPAHEAPPVPEPAPAPASKPVAVVAPAPPSPETLYESAEAALGKGDMTGADRIFAQLVAAFPQAALVDQALYERARIAYRRHAWRDAQHELDLLAAIASTPLAEPGAYLSCRIAIEAHDGAAEHCLLEYRKAYPSSPHDLDVLGVLAELAYKDGGCVRARSRIDELVRSHPRSTLAHAWTARCPEDR